MKDFVFYQAAYEIGQAQSWSDWHDKNWGNDHLDVPGLGLVTVVDRKFDDRDESNWYSQGSESDLSVTFEVDLTAGGLRYFRKYGVSDSYGRDTFDGEFVEVQPVEKKIVAFETVK